MEKMSFLHMKHWLSVSFEQCLGDGLAETSVPTESHVVVQVCWEQFEASCQWFHLKLVAPVHSLKPLCFSLKITLRLVGRV